MSNQTVNQASSITASANGFNNFVVGLLRSPFHWLASRSMMLISVTGRKSGRTYTTPVNYLQRGSTLYVISRQGRTWWKNITKETPVSVVLRGQAREGWATLAEDERSVTQIYQMMYPRMKPEKIATRAPSRVLIVIELNRG